MQERLQKIISRAGIASRRHAEQLILSGAVTVNGRVITELGSKADAERDHITVGPRVVRMQPGEKAGYFAFHKPAQVVSTLNDPEGRPCLGPYVRRHKGRLFPVGRLEFDAAGLLLLTGDGELASDLMRGAAAISQTWRFKVKGRIEASALRGIEREAHARVRTYRDAANSWYEATLRNAPRDLLRQTLERQGILVEKLVRSTFGGVELGSLEPGELRELSAVEVSALRRAARGRPEGSDAAAEHLSPLASPRNRPESREGIANAIHAWRRASPRRRPQASQANSKPGRNRHSRNAAGRSRNKQRHRAPRGRANP